jgi:hypothetical protein
MSHTENWYCWRVLTIPRDEETGEAMEETPRLLVPWSDPNKHEFAFDFIFQTPEKARKGLETWGAEDDAVEEGWVLCRQTLEVVGAKRATLLFAAEDGERHKLADETFFGKTDDEIRAHMIDSYWEGRLDITSCSAVVEIEEVDDE